MRRETVKVVTLSRKPCTAPSTTANVVKHHAGALNVDVCRIGVTSNTDLAVYRENSSGDRGHETNRSRHLGFGMGGGHADGSGRWPANVILRHRATCRQAGTTVVPGYAINRWTDGAKPFGGGAGHAYENEKQPDESVAVWACEDGCAVLSLSAQSGWQVSGRHGTAPGGFGGAALYGDGSRTLDVSGGYSDTGTAARYFKQVQESEMDEIPAELIDYLVTMISPPPSCEPNVIVRLDLDDYPWEEHEDSSVHGIVTMGDPGPHLEDIDRVLRPGAHLLLVSPEDEPTGHTGACAVEDFGYEIRDAIAVLDAPGEFHYVAKSGPTERNAGIVARESESGRVVQNDHPTVKPVAIMEALLSDVPARALVVDPFMGSGTTGIACLRTGHDFIGIDQGPQYLQIADQRLRHWDRSKNAWNGATIESEAEFEDEEPVGLEDLFGFGGDDDEDAEVGDCPVCEQRDTEIEVKVRGERLEVCSACAEDREQVRIFLLKLARGRVEELK